LALHSRFLPYFAKITLILHAFHENLFKASSIL
jgi:hypothetical protein